MTFDLTATKLAQESTSAKALLAEIGSDDETLNADMIEGETSLCEAIDRALSEMDDCEIIISGCKEVEGKIAARRVKAEKRLSRVRGLIEQALVVCNLDGMKRPTATLSVRKVKPKPIVTDEALIPSEFWKQPDPVLDRTKINQHDGPIEGVTMSNGGTSLQIRRV